LQRTPRGRDTRTRARPTVIDKQSERGAGEESAEMRRVADEIASHKTDEQVYEDDRQQARAKHALESFRKLATVLDAEHEQHTDQSEQSSRRASRRPVSASENESPQQSMSKRRPQREITCHYSGNSSHHPKHNKLRRTIKLLDEWSEYQQGEHVHQQVQNVQMNKHRRDEAPPLIIRRIDQVIERGTVRNKHDVGKALLQNPERKPARLPHQ